MNDNCYIFATVILSTISPSFPFRKVLFNTSLQPFLWHTDRRTEIIKINILCCKASGFETKLPNRKILIHQVLIWHLCTLSNYTICFRLYKRDSKRKIYFDALTSFLWLWFLLLFFGRFGFFGFGFIDFCFITPFRQSLLLQCFNLSKITNHSLLKLNKSQIRCRK